MTPIIIDDESICMLICINYSHLSDISFSHFHVTHENSTALSFHSNCKLCTTMQHAFTTKKILHIKKLTAICNFHPSHALSFRWELQLAFALPRAAEVPIELRWAPPISKSWEWTGEMKPRLITLLTLSRIAYWIVLCWNVNSSLRSQSNSTELTIFIFVFMKCLQMFLIFH